MPKKIQKKKKGKTAPQAQEVRPKDFLDLIAPAAVKFNTDHCSVEYRRIRRQPNCEVLISEAMGIAFVPVSPSN